MMKQRRRMLMSGGVDLDKMFSNTTYIMSRGNNSSNSQGTATLLSSELPSDEDIYLFGYSSTYFIVCRYRNQQISIIYRNSPDITLYTWEGNPGDNWFRVNIKSNDRFNCVGLVALSFGINVDTTLKNLFDNTKYVAGANGSSAYRYLYYSNISSETERRYIFVGVGENFCIYKSEGLTYSDLVLMFNSGLTLQDYTTSKTKIGSSSTYGYTCLSAKG